MGNLFIITGASGTGVSESLQRYCRQHGGHIVRLEEHLAEVARPYLGYDLDRPSMREVVTLPPAILRTLWPQACRSACTGPDRSVAELLPHGDVFLTFHAAWYHLGTTSFVSAVDLGTLIRQLVGGLLSRESTVGQAPRMVITLIDDIYDTLARLMRPNQVFEHELPDDANPITAVSRLLMKILTWREYEVRFSQQISVALGDEEIPHILFAVKHPMTTFQNLVQTTSPRRIYLSHPISDPRRHGLDSRDGSAMVRYVSGVSASLRNAKNMVLIEPTAIDELRFEEHDERLRLKPRWPAPVDESGNPVEQLWDGLMSSNGDLRAAERDLAFAKQPFEEAFRRAETDRRRLGIEPSEQSLTQAEAVADARAVIKILEREIDQQVNWRDRQLVSESNGLVVIRPFSKDSGSHSRSVGREMDLYLRLREFETSRYRTTERIPALVYHPSGDEHRRRIRAIGHVLDHLASNGKIRNWSLAAHEELSELLKDIDLTEWVASGPGKIGEKITDVFARMQVVPPPGVQPADARALDAGAGLSATPEREVGETLMKAIRGVEVPGHPEASTKFFDDPHHAQVLGTVVEQPVALGRDLAARAARSFDDLLEEPGS